MTRQLLVLDLGHVPYTEGLELQRDLRERRIAGQIDRDLLLLLEHEATVTLGRGTRDGSLPLSPDDLRERGLTVVEVERGGDVTWHGPGQLVGYPILDLGGHRRDLHWYLRQVEQVLIEALDTLGIPAERNPKFTGVWTAGRKIASIGVHVRQWVTTHGFALNVTNSLAEFDLIVPCGIAGVRMTSVAEVLGNAAGPDPDEIRTSAAEAVARSFGRVFDLEPVPGALALIEGTAEPVRAY